MSMLSARSLYLCAVVATPFINDAASEGDDKGDEEEYDTYTSCDIEQEIAIHEVEPTPQDNNSNHHDLEQWLKELLERYRKSRAQAVMGIWFLKCSTWWIGGPGNMKDTHTWGYETLVVPRLLDSLPVKHKWQSTHPEPRLYKQADYVSLVQATKIHDSISWSQAKPFLECGHPLVWTGPLFPPVHEWVFQLGMSVCFGKNKTLGLVEVVSCNVLKLVDLNGGSSTIVSWRDVCKDIQVGDYVEITGLVTIGSWINHVKGNNVNIIQQAHLLSNASSSDANTIEVGNDFVTRTTHCNCAVVTTPPHSKAMVTPLSIQEHQVSVPWWYQLDTASYWWEHPDLCNKEMHVFLPSHKKEVMVKVMTLGGQVALARTFFSKPAAMDYTQVRIWHPHQRDYDLWLIIHGEHVVRIVHVKPGEVNTPTDITICLPATHLVLVPEQPDDKKLNDDLKQTLRKQFEEHPKL
ncbi:uncharacterized protein EV420DRAFT_1474662 [Desarmillaria tabescens]|uniref:Uncharacterized protein n=1 Tax=Armillaria tabescens TaxID=1929756 RepID=A0AA39NKM7_ARMTA|nr:uncharacterized protein EV420DRAFT_1474662 [Desarmillaria tabescens]KAK0467342.1 hypothetical protein EV420DRAFT_1474662 [Desarmillaria tabescens]